MVPSRDTFQPTGTARLKPVESVYICQPAGICAAGGAAADVVTAAELGGVDGTAGAAGAALVIGDGAPDVCAFGAALSLPGTTAKATTSSAITATPATSSQRFGSARTAVP